MYLAIINLFFLGYSMVHGDNEAVDGGWSSWDITMTKCTVTCGQGQSAKSHRRLCNNPKPENGGQNCEGDKIMYTYEACETNVTCPVDGGWGSWFVNRTVCCASCGQGTYLQFYLRDCTNPKPAGAGKHCVGSNLASTVVKTCNTSIPCRVDGGWGSWVVHTTNCSRDCGLGRYLEYNTRECDNPRPVGTGKPCAGSYLGTTAVKICNTKIPCAGPSGALSCSEIPKIEILTYLVAAVLAVVLAKANLDLFFV